MAEPHVLTALNAKYARISGELGKLNNRADKLRIDMAHIEATIRLFRADWSGDGVAPIQPMKPSRWHGRGTGLQTALTVMREAGQPMTARQIAEKALAKHGIGLPDAKTLSAVSGSLAASLERRVGKGVVMHGGKPRRWAVSSPT